MANDPFESGAIGPGQEVNEGFKMFGMSVNQFSAAVAGADVLFKVLEQRTKARSQKENLDRKKNEDIAKQQEEAADMQVEAAEINKDIAKKAEASSKSNQATTTKWQRMTAAFDKAVKSFGSVMKDTWTKSIDGFKGIIGDLAGVVKDFGARFIVVFTAVNILTRILTNLMDTANQGAMLRRSLGPAFAARFSRTGTEDSFVDETLRLTGGRMQVSDIADAAIALNEELRDVSRITPKIIADVADIAQGLNIDVGTAAAFVGQAMFATNATSQDVKAAFAEIALVAAEAGLTADSLAQSLASTPEYAQQWVMATKQGRLELARAAATARILGTDLSSIRTTADQFFDLGAAATEAARLQALGVQGFSASRIVQGALTDPTTLVRSMLTDVRSQFGELNAASGVDRFKLQSILAQSATLGNLFDTESLARALTAVGRAEELNQVIQERTATVEAAAKFEENALKHLQDLVINGRTLEDKVEHLANGIANSIADVLRPLFTGLMDAVNDLVSVLESIPGFKRKSTAQMVSEADAEAARVFLTSRLSQDIINKTGVAADSVVTSEELTAMVKGRIDQMTSLGMNVPSEQQEALLKELQEFVALQREYFSREHKVQLVGFNGRVFAEMMERSGGAAGKM